MFGDVENLESVDFTLPPDDPQTKKVLEKSNYEDSFQIFVGLGKWNRKDIIDFFPRGIIGELEYYSSQFYCIELNATFYQPYELDSYEKWYNKTPAGFKFFPKVNQTITHVRRLNNVEDLTLNFLHSASGLKDKLGTILLQLHDKFGPKDFNRIDSFLNFFPPEIKLAVEARHEDWFKDKQVTSKLFELFEKHRVTNVIHDTAGRRDTLHMRLTSPIAYIRFEGYNESSDLERLNLWADRIKDWKNKGLKKVCFIINQNKGGSLLNTSAYFIRILNEKLGLDMMVPHTVKKS